MPVILASGVIARLDIKDVLLNAVRAAGNFEYSENMLNTVELYRLLLQMKMDRGFITYIIGAVDRIYMMVNSTGVQILIFLAGLQTIPPSLFEASNIEGATGWENFWKITFPMMGPQILTATVYSVIDALTRENNELIVMIKDIAFAQSNFGLSAAMAWVYFSFIIVLVAVLFGLLSRRIFYHE
jgi:ABC-type sugar transport systems, permease components